VNAMQAYAKAIAAGIMALLAVMVTLTGASVPQWITEDWLLTLFAALTPLIVLLTPNRP